MAVVVVSPPISGQRVCYSTERAGISEDGQWAHRRKAVPNVSSGGESQREQKAKGKNNKNNTEEQEQLEHQEHENTATATATATRRNAMSMSHLAVLRMVLRSMHTPVATAHRRAAAAAAA